MCLQVAQVQYNAMEEQAAQQRQLDELARVHAQASNDARALQLQLRWANDMNFCHCSRTAACPDERILRVQADRKLVIDCILQLPTVCSSAQFMTTA